MLLAISDLHGFLPEDLPACEFLCIVGDICPVTNHDRKFQADWLRGTFTEWLEHQPAKNVVYVAGNHDFVLEESKKVRNALPAHYICNEAVEINGVKFWGSPLSGRFGGWAFMKNEAELAHEWEKIPEDTDVLMTHGPAYGLCDKTYNGMPAGSKSLRDAILRIKPRYALTGHIHEGYGHEHFWGTDVYNCSYVNFQYQPGNPPWAMNI